MLAAKSSVGAVPVPRCEQRAVVTPIVSDSSTEGLFELVRQPMGKFLRSGQHFKAVIEGVDGYDFAFRLGGSCTLGNIMDALLDCIIIS